MRSVTDEHGSTLVATILVTMVVIVLGVMSLRLAVHTNEVTSIDRMRAQALQAADAGANAAINRLQTNAACDTAVSAPFDLTDGSRTLSKFQTRIDPHEGTSCFDTDQRVIRSWGFAPAESERSLRHVQVGVQLIPHDGFRFTLFASGPTGVVTVHNTGTIDGDVYAEDLNQTQNNLNANDVVTPGSIFTKDNAVYGGTLWAGGNIEVNQNGQVAGAILAAGSSAPGNVLMQNGVVVGRDVRAKGNVGLGTTTKVHGSISDQNPSVPVPPNLELPTFVWDPANYSPAPVTFTNASTASTHIASISTDLQGTFYIDDSSGNVNMTKGSLGSSPFNVTGPTTIITTGKVLIGRDFSATGGPHQVVIISLNTAQDAIQIDKPMTASSNLDLLLFTYGGVDIKNSTTFKGSVYADAIYLKNSATIGYSTSLANSPPAGFDFGSTSVFRFTVFPTLWREITPSLPPA